MSEKKIAPLPEPKVHKPKHAVPTFESLLGEDADGLACVTNDVIEAEEGRLRYQAALERSNFTTEMIQKGSFSAVWFYVFRVESRNDDGEITGSHFRVVFMDGLGNTYETHSDTATRTLRNWIATRGWGEWAEPAHFTVEAKKGVSGRTYHQLRLVAESIMAPSSP